MNKENVREFFEKPAGKLTAVVIFAVAMLMLWVMSRTKTPAEDAANSRVYVCSETGKSFRVSLKAGMGVPVHSPHSGKDTGYPAEECFWTADGSVKKEPTYVLLNEAVGKAGPTFCPDCGRLVRGHNPAPTEGSRPPPTPAEYKPGKRGSASAER